MFLVEPVPYTAFAPATATIVIKAGGDCMDIELERTFIANFVLKSKRERMQWEACTLRKRSDYIWTLPRVLDERFMFEVVCADRTDMYRHLVKAGAPDQCYFFSHDPDFDGRKFSLHDTFFLNECFRHVELIVCDPEHLAFLYDEDQKKYILKK